MKSILRLIFLLGLLAGCSTVPINSENDKAPVEDKSLTTRNPYAPAGIFIPQTEQTTVIAAPAPIVNNSDSKKPSLLFEEESTEPPVISQPASPPQAQVHSLWIWPTDNKIIRQYNSGSVDAKGIDFSGKVGDSIRAARSGKVVFSGAGLKGYGQLIIIKHNNNMLTAYAHNHNLLVKEGDLVDTGQVIAEMGLNEATSVPMLHFEIRLNGKPVDPSTYLPVRL